MKEPMRMVVEAKIEGQNALITFTETSAANPLLKAGSYLLTHDAGQTMFLVDPESVWWGAEVAARLEQFGVKARGMAEGMAAPDVVHQAISDARNQHLASLPNPNQLGPLMGKYKDSCQALVLQNPSSTS